MDDKLIATGPTGGPRVVGGSRGVEWWSEAWALFTKAGLLWVVMAVIVFVVLAVLGFIPIIGALASALILPVFGGSWMLAARKVEDGGTLEVGDLFKCFSGEKLTPLLVLGALLLAAMIVIGLVTGALGLGALLGVAAGGARGSAGGVLAALSAGMLALLVGLVLGMLVTMVTWFAPALVVFQGKPPVEAMKASFDACLKNIVPFLLWSLIYFVAAIVASIPFGLGWLLLGPVSALTAYVSYKDVFG